MREKISTTRTCVIIIENWSQNPKAAIEFSLGLQHFP